MFTREQCQRQYLMCRAGRTILAHSGVLELASPSVAISGSISFVVGSRSTETSRRSTILCLSAFNSSYAWFQSRGHRLRGALSPPQDPAVSDLCRQTAITQAAAFIGLGQTWLTCHIRKVRLHMRPSPAGAGLLLTKAKWRPRNGLEHQREQR